MNPQLESDKVLDLINSYLQNSTEELQKHGTANVPRTAHSLESKITKITSHHIKQPSDSEMNQRLFGTTNRTSLISHDSDLDQSDESVGGDSITSESDYRYSVVNSSKYLHFDIHKVQNGKLVNALAHQVFGTESFWGKIEQECLNLLVCSSLTQKTKANPPVLNFKSLNESDCRIVCQLIANFTNRPVYILMALKRPRMEVISPQTRYDLERLEPIRILCYGIGQYASLIQDSEIKRPVKKDSKRVRIVDQGKVEKQDSLRDQIVQSFYEGSSWSESDQIRQEFLEQGPASAEGSINEELILQKPRSNSIEGKYRYSPGLPRKTSRADDEHDLEQAFAMSQDDDAQFEKDLQFALELSMKEASSRSKAK